MNHAKMSEFVLGLAKESGLGDVKLNSKPQGSVEIMLPDCLVQFFLEIVPGISTDINVGLQPVIRDREFGGFATVKEDMGKILGIETKMTFVCIPHEPELQALTKYDQPVENTYTKEVYIPQGTVEVIKRFHSSLVEKLKESAGDHGKRGRAYFFWDVDTSKLFSDSFAGSRS